MSAFMVDSKTIVSIAYGIMTPKLRYSVSRRSYVLSEEARSLLGDGEGGTQSPKSLRGWEDLADWMHVMNLEAMKHRYGMEELLESTEFVDLEEAPAKLSGTHLFKALSCFLYQCTEGDAIQDSALFMALHAVCKQLPYHVVKDSKAYREAPWG